MNKRLNLNISIDCKVLTKDDIISIIKYLNELFTFKKEIDDIDHLSNRRVKTVGEQLSTQFSIGLARTARNIREKMNIRDNEIFTPVDLINAKTLSSVVNTFFGTSQLSQFMDQVNPLSEITHKRRLSALGPGGISRKRAGFEVRDVHYSHYGRLCPIETPEGPNIGLVTSLCTYASINNMGFIETLYWPVHNGKVNFSKPISLGAYEEEGKLIADSNVALNADGSFIKERIIARKDGDFPLVKSKEINYIDVMPNQIASISASLIPFLEHDDANRALMGSNMMRQSVPLLQPKAPIVGTGLEHQVAMDSRILINAEGNGIVEYVDANNIIINYDQTYEDSLISFDSNIKKYNLIKFRKTNQNTCITLKPIVKKGDHVINGQVLCQGYATENGELALGRDCKVAFMPLKGYNFEDAIVISERIVREDWFTSIHIDEYSLDVRETKLGIEEFTNDIPNVSEESTKYLDENGLVMIGTHVSNGDILIGKITPKGEYDPTPEEKLLRAIFGDKAGNVKDVSLRADPSLFGVVIDTKLFSRNNRRKDKKSKAKDKTEIERIEAEYKNNFFQLREQIIEKLSSLLEGEISKGIFLKNNKVIASGVKFTRKLLNNIKDYNDIIEILCSSNEKNNLISKILHNFKKN